MFGFHPAVFNAFIGLIGVLLLVFAWRSVSSLPALARWGLRFVLAAIIIAPFALLILAPSYEMARAPAPEAAAPDTSDTRVDERSGGGRASLPKKKREIIIEPPRESDRETDVARAPDAANGASKPQRSRGPVVPDASAPRDDATQPGMPDLSGVGTGGGGPGAGRDIGLGGDKPPASANGGGADKDTGMGRSHGITFGRHPTPYEIAPGGGTGDGAVTRSGERAPATGGAAPDEEKAGAAPEVAAAVGPEEDWTVVPVYYGTDRARVPNDKRVDYGSDRGRRLELGRAMVSVPKAHEVPQVERPWAITIPYFNYKIYEEKEDPKKHFIIQEIKDLSEADLLALVKERLAKSARYKDHAFVFVHGYNTSFDFAVYRAAQIAYDIKFDGAPFVYSWPSGGGIASYTYDRESTTQAEPYFTDFLKMVTQKSGAKHVSIIAHSMGNQLLLRVLQDLKRTRPEGVSISQIIFAAPDVDRDSFETIAGQLKDFATGGLTLYTAANDRALGVSRRFYGGVPRAGDVPPEGPLIVSGIDTIDATAVSMDSLGLHHSGYAESNALLQDIGLLIQTGERPPGKRVPILQQVTTAKGDYWRYPGGP